MPYFCLKLVVSRHHEICVNATHTVSLDVKDQILVLGRGLSHDPIQIHSDVVTGHVESADRKRKPLEL